MHFRSEFSELSQGGEIRLTPEVLRIVADLLALGDEDVTALVVSHVLDIAPEIAAAAEVARCPDAQLCKVWPALLLQSHSLVRRHTRKRCHIRGRGLLTKDTDG